jgi:hypothetical protein
MNKYEKDFREKMLKRMGREELDTINRTFEYCLHKRKHCIKVVCGKENKIKRERPFFNWKTSCLYARGILSTNRFPTLGRRESDRVGWGLEASAHKWQQAYKNAEDGVQVLGEMDRHGEEFIKNSLLCFSQN